MLIFTSLLNDFGLIIGTSTAAMEFPRVDRKKWATSDGSLGATMISLFESGNFYDCTIKVGSEATDGCVKVMIIIDYHIISHLYAPF